MTNGRISFNLESFERNVNSCNPGAMDYATSLGADLDKMESNELARFRTSINKYKEDCTCVRIPLPTKEKAGAIVCEIKGKITAATEKAAPTIEKIKIAVTPTIETAKEKVYPTLEKIKTGVSPTVEELRRKYYTV